jgi:hypothetical protein
LLLPLRIGGSIQHGSPSCLRSRFRLLTPHHLASAS